MFSKIKDAVGNIFHIDEKEKAEEAQKTANLQQKTNSVFGTTSNSNSATNPFLTRSGELANPNLDYKRLADNPKLSSKAKQYNNRARWQTPANACQLRLWISNL